MDLTNYYYVIYCLPDWREDWIEGGRYVSFRSGFGRNSDGYYLRFNVGEVNEQVWRSIPFKASWDIKSVLLKEDFVDIFGLITDGLPILEIKYKDGEVKVRTYVRCMPLEGRGYVYIMKKTGSGWILVSKSRWIS